MLSYKVTSEQLVNILLLNIIVFISCFNIIYITDISSSFQRELLFRSVAMIYLPKAVSCSMMLVACYIFQSKNHNKYIGKYTDIICFSAICCSLFPSYVKYGISFIFIDYKAYIQEIYAVVLAILILVNLIVFLKSTIKAFIWMIPFIIYNMYYIFYVIL